MIKLLPYIIVASFYFNIYLIYFFINRGRGGIMTPFIYYHFLTLRYTSKRNPNTRNMFHELRLAVEAVANNPKAPSILGKVLHTGVRLVCKVAPQMQPQAPQ